MFYYLSNIAWFFATPSNLVASLILLGLALALVGRTRRAGFGLAVTAAIGLLVMGLSPLGTLLILPLEQRFPAFQDDGRPVDGVVVLGGAVQAEETVRRGQLTVNEAGERFIAALDLGRRYPGARILLSGGSGALLVDEPPEADITADYLVRLGLPRDRLVLENRSRTTAENAVFSRRIADPKPGERWLLVTSAWHMPRSVAAFRKAGFPVTAYPVDYRTTGTGDLLPFAFVSEGLRRVDVAAKEWAGLVGYYVGGRTGELFPSPSSGVAAAMR
ncbi:YdcF family protein [Salinarimonas soli]|uniref:YdcF family protein n=1 Tax=Salinarimonas soli TaxID=1638099 RepID=A0A5B2VI16_9HYPH|nr:YdcF family protein [Salinarimonas soli]KAA2237992.1 YdcF family protein [Salinarimonas soli]